MPVAPEPNRGQALRWSAWGLLVVLCWDAAGWDIALAQLSASPSGFMWRDHPLLSDVLHSGARTAGWGVLLACTALAVWPLGPLKTLPARERAGWVGSIWLALGLVVMLKGLSRTSCPWDLTLFGGSVPPVSHWAWGLPDGGPGHCFPAGHASTGFAFVAGSFWLAPHHPRLAQRWQWVALAAGVLLGGAQQLRGAHFMSHTLWTAWLCWSVGALGWHLSHRQIP